MVASVVEEADDEDEAGPPVVVEVPAESVVVVDKRNVHCKNHFLLFDL